MGFAQASERKIVEKGGHMPNYTLVYVHKPKGKELRKGHFEFCIDNDDPSDNDGQALLYAQNFIKECANETNSEELSKIYILKMVGSFHKNPDKPGPELPTQTIFG